MLVPYAVTVIFEDGYRGHYGAKVDSSQKAVEKVKSRMTWREKERAMEFQVMALDGKKKVEVIKA